MKLHDFGFSEGINFGKPWRISFSTGFVRKYNLQDHKYVYLSVPEISNKGIKIGFIFNKNDQIVDGAHPLKLSKHPRSPRFQIQPKSWFEMYSINQDEINGDYPVMETTDPKLGKTYIVLISKK